MATRNTELVGSISAALERGDRDAVLAALDQEVESVEPDTPGLPFAGVHRGREGVVRNFTDTAAFLAALGSPAVSSAS